MANAYIQTLGDGSTVEYDLTFTYIDQAYVKAYIDGVPVTFTWVTPTRISLDVVATTLETILIIRETNITTRLTDYGDGSDLTETDLDLDSQQAFDLIQEREDAQELYGSSAATLEVITVTGVTQGKYSSGDVIPIGTALEEIITNMLVVNTPPTLVLSGNGSLVVEAGTLLDATLTPVFVANDAGAILTYELRKDAVPIDTVYGAYNDLPAFNVFDGISFVYEATVGYDINIVPAGSIISNTVTYRGARSMFSDLGGDIVNIRTNTVNTVDVQVGTVINHVGDGVELTYIFSYPDTIAAFTKLEFSNTGGTFDITADVVTEATQSVNDASGANPITYKVYSYTALIPIAVTDTLILTI